MVTAPRPLRPDRPDAPAPEASTPMQLRVPGHLARRFHRIHVAVMNEALAAEDLTAASYGALVTIGRAPGITQRALADDGGLDVVTTGQMIDALEARGLVQRHPDPSDRRAWRLELTDDGRLARERAVPLALAAQQRMLSALSRAEVAKLQELLAIVIRANAPYDKPGAGRKRPVRKAPNGAG